MLETDMMEMLEAGFCGECTHALTTETLGQQEVDYCWFCEHSINSDGSVVQLKLNQ